VRQRSINPGIRLRPGDRFNLTHSVTLNNDTDETVTLVGWRFEPVFATDTPPELAALLEERIVDAIGTQ
jgi:hypothetical protein